MEAFSVSGCFPCLSGAGREQAPPPPSAPADPRSDHHDVPAAARTFSFEELSAAAGNFRDEYLVAGRKARLYRGHLNSLNTVVVMKLQHLVDWIGSTEQHNSKFLARVAMLNLLRHPNLLNLIGFCADGNHRVLVHEYMRLGSLEDRLHDPSPYKAQLDWSTRMNIAAGVASGLEYLHDKGVVYRVMTSSDILLGNGHHPKLSQYGLVELGQPLFDNPENETLVWPKSFDIYRAPEIDLNGRPTATSGVYSFGVVLLELITGRRAFANTSTRPDPDDRILVEWAQPLLSKRKFRRMADPALQGRYPSMGLEEALTVASMWVQRDPTMRPPIGTVVTALARLADDRSS